MNANKTGDYAFLSFSFSLSLTKKKKMSQEQPTGKKRVLSNPKAHN